jgi:hypothetical protein
MLYVAADPRTCATARTAFLPAIARWIEFPVRAYLSAKVAP